MADTKPSKAQLAALTRGVSRSDSDTSLPHQSSSFGCGIIDGKCTNLLSSKSTYLSKKYKCAVSIEGNDVFAIYCSCMTARAAESIAKQIPETRELHVCTDCADQRAVLIVQRLPSGAMFIVKRNTTKHSHICPELLQNSITSHRPPPTCRDNVTTSTLADSCSSIQSMDLRRRKRRRLPTTRIHPKRTRLNEQKSELYIGCDDKPNSADKFLLLNEDNAVDIPSNMRLFKCVSCSSVASVEIDSNGKEVVRNESSHNRRCQRVKMDKIMASRELMKKLGQTDKGDEEMENVEFQLSNKPKSIEVIVLDSDDDSVMTLPSQTPFKYPVFVKPVSDWLKKHCIYFGAGPSCSEAYKVWAALAHIDFESAVFPRLENLKYFTNAYRLVSYLFTATEDNMYTVKEKINKAILKSSLNPPDEFMDKIKDPNFLIGIVFSPEMLNTHFSVLRWLLKCTVVIYDYTNMIRSVYEWAENGVPTIVVGKDEKGYFIFC